MRMRLVAHFHGGCDSVIRALTAQDWGSELASQRLPVFNFSSRSAQNLKSQVYTDFLLLPVRRPAIFLHVSAT